MATPQEPRKPLYCYHLEFSKKGHTVMVHATFDGGMDYHALTFVRDEEEAHYIYIAYIPKERPFTIDQLRDFVRQLHERGTYTSWDTEKSNPVNEQPFRKVTK